MACEKRIVRGTAHLAREKIFSYMHDVLDMSIRRIDVRYNGTTMIFAIMYEPFLSNINELKKTILELQDRPDRLGHTQSHLFRIIRENREYYRKHFLAMSEYIAESKLERVEVYVGEHQLFFLNLLRLNERRETA